MKIIHYKNLLYQLRIFFQLRAKTKNLENTSPIQRLLEIQKH